MLAGQFTAPRRIELVEAPEPILDPAPPPGEPGEIIFQPETACLCGSDLPFFDSAFDGDAIEYPRQLGHSLHEMVGTVIATNGKKFKAGDRVLAVPINQVGFFERYKITEARAIPLDPRVPDDLAVMAQPLGTVIFALKKLPLLLDQDVVVVGQGPIGQLFNLALRNLGARQIIGIDKLSARLARSPSCGATATICNADQHPGDAVLTLTDGLGPDVVIEAVGHKEQALNLCMEVSRLNGRLLYFGVPPLRIHDVRWNELFRKNLTIHTSVNPDFRRDFPLALRWIAEGRVDVRPLVTHSYPLAQIQTAFEVFHQRIDGALKVLVKFPSAKS